MDIGGALVVGASIVLVAHFDRHDRIHPLLLLSDRLHHIIDVIGSYMTNCNEKVGIKLGDRQHLCGLDHHSPIADDRMQNESQLSLRKFEASVVRPSPH